MLARMILALRVASVPEADFAAQVESDRSPTVVGCSCTQVATEQLKLQVSVPEHLQFCTAVLTSRQQR
jgi:hypothetical protein